MTIQSDITLTDELERDLIERELGAQNMGFGNDVKRLIASAQNIFTRLQAEARKAKVVYANG
ncbi:hypothetical protein [Cupriavidus metallidurans]|uniref:hypothetical protein n=1 Tax=Cupriavidus metallidurans TaxID=119219 RepID=UPI00055FE944|nr:hypothetical protein [Cupriavidus metallidurans]